MNPIHLSRSSPRCQVLSLSLVSDFRLGPSMRRNCMSQEIDRSKVIMRGIMKGLLALGLTGCVTIASAQDKKSGPPPHDAIADAQMPKTGAIVRPEQRKTEHDRSGIFEAQKARPSSPTFLEQPRDGKM